MANEMHSLLRLERYNVRVDGHVERRINEAEATKTPYIIHRTGGNH